MHFTYAQREQQREAEALDRRKPQWRGCKALYPHITKTGVCHRKWDGAKWDATKAQSAESSVQNEKADCIPEIGALSKNLKGLRTPLDAR